MTFKDIKGEDLIGQIKERHQQSAARKMFMTVFYEVYPESKILVLKKQYKPHEKIPGMYSAYNNSLQAQQGPKELMREKLLQNDLLGQNHLHFDASLKLHININNIAELDDSIIHGLMDLLIEAPESPISFKFIDPALLVDKEKSGIERFQNTDQLTLYFDKYHSASDLTRLAKKIEDYLLAKGVPKNRIDRGPKDSFVLNSFVSARFDTNKLLGKYGVYKFFDLELEKFFNKHSEHKLTFIPLCAFEAVFNSILFMDQIVNLQVDSGLSVEESRLAQAEFEKMWANPQAYLSTSKVIKKEEQETPQPTLIDPNSINFYALIEQIKNKSKQLIEEGDADRASKAFILYKELTSAFNVYQQSNKSKPDYLIFKDKCDLEITKAKSHLKNHRGWNNLFVNLLIGIASLGIAFLFNYKNTQGKAFFFHMKTDSVNKIEQISNAIDEMSLACT